MIGENERAQAGYSFCRREHLRDRGAFPRPRERAVVVAAPDVDDGLAVDEHAGRRADVLAALELYLERVFDALELRVPGALDRRRAAVTFVTVSHMHSSSFCRSRRGMRRSWARTVRLAG